MTYATFQPFEVRAIIRKGEITSPTAGMCNGYAQANLVILPKEFAYDFLLFAQRNPKACPVLEVLDPGDRRISYMADGADIATDFPRYRVYEQGKMTGEYTEIVEFWKSDFVSFLIGCSFSFEEELLQANISIRHIEEGCNVPMYLTNIECEPAGVFSGNMVVSMRPIPYQDVIKAINVTAAMPKVHGAPIHVGDPSLIGITDINSPDFGDRVTMKEGEVPVFWPCGVTPQAVIMASKVPFAITHAPGHMFITDVKNINLKY